MWVENDPWIMESNGLTVPLTGCYSSVAYFGLRLLPLFSNLAYQYEHQGVSLPAEPEVLWLPCHR